MDGIGHPAGQLIMEYIYLILGLISLFFIGYAPVYFLLPGRGGFRAGSRSVSGGFFIFFLSFFTGALMTGWLMTVLSLFDISFGPEIVYGTSAVFFVFYIYNYLSIRFRSSERKSINRLDRDMLTAKEKSREKEKKTPEKYRAAPSARRKRTAAARQREPRASRIVFAVLTALIIINFGAVLFLAILFPIRFWDAVSCWSLKGKAFFLDGIINDFYILHDYGFSHPSYPLYLPLMQTWLLSWMREVNENLVKAIFPLFYSSLLFTLYYLFRQRLGKLVSILFVFIISFLPVIADHGYIEYTNLLFSVILLLAVYFLYLAIAINGKTSYLILSAVFFAILALTRSEGIIYVIIFILLSLFFFTRRLTGGYSLKKNLLNLLMPLAVFIIFLIPWYLLKLRLGIPAVSTEWEMFLGKGSMDFGRAAAVMGRQFLLSAYDSTRAVLGSFYGPLWVLMLIAMFFRLKQHFRDYNWIFFVFIAAGMISIFASLAAIPDFANSAERYILHLFPVTYYWVMTNSIGKSLKDWKGNAV
jgi:hypothetical protein